MDKTYNALAERYKDKHPLLFSRSLEYAKSYGELFDIMEGIPELPVIWDNDSRRWVTSDLVQSQSKSMDEA